MLGLDHVQLAAPPECEPEARRFYGDILGLREVPKPEPLQRRGGVWFSLGTHQLHIGVEDPFAPARKAHPALLVTDDTLESIARRLIDNDAPVKWDDALRGIRRFYTQDPWRNRIEIIARA